MKKYLSILILVIVLLTSCEKGDEGPIGPAGINCWDVNLNGLNDVFEDTNNDGVFTAEDCQGQTGSSGPNGSTGAQGPPGPQGATGATGQGVDDYVFDIEISSLIEDSLNKMWSSDIIDVPNLSEGDLVSVFAYLDFTSESPEWIALPTSHFFNNSNEYNLYTFSTTDENKLKLYIRNSTGSQPFTPMQGIQSIKVFLIEGSGKTALEEMNVDITNYEELSQFSSAFENN